MAAINNEYPADFSKAYYDALDNLPGRDIRGLAAIYSAVDYALTRGLDNGQLKTFVEIFRDISQDTGIERVDPTILFRAANMFRGRDTVEDFWCLRKYETAAAGMSHTRYQKALHGLLGVMLRPSGIPAKRPDIRPAA
ncbi:MAG TPA: hypothetical protein VFR09_00340 [Alphaproteobacteria bacterium]|nr:hypothetical protein [Alphaproteobacteria bacterium]